MTQAETEVSPKPGGSVIEGEKVRRIHISNFSVEIWFEDDSVIRITEERLAPLKTQVIPNGFNRDD